MSAYDVLYDNLPDYFKNVKEFIQILKAHGYGLDELNENIRSIYNNLFIQTADSATLSYYENLLGISVSPDDTIAYRRQRIIQQLSLVPRFDINWLKEKLNSLYGEDGYSLDINPEECVLSIEISSGSYNSMRLFYDFIWDVIPAHIEIPTSQYANTDIPVGMYNGGAMLSTKISFIGGELWQPLIQSQ